MSTYELPEDPYFPAKRQADEVAAELRTALFSHSIVLEGGDRWPEIAGRATLAGRPFVWMGAVPLPMAQLVIESLTDLYKAKLDAQKLRTRR